MIAGIAIWHGYKSSKSFTSSPHSARIVEPLRRYTRTRSGIPRNRCRVLYSFGCLRLLKLSLKASRELESNQSILTSSNSA
ncbi:MAG: hypothetical protein ACI9HK_004641 [Pirellulaceae bacterium]|jgi:hypothetical protein